jgi:hypothetical protein
MDRYGMAVRVGCIYRRKLTAFTQSLYPTAYAPCTRTWIWTLQVQFTGLARPARITTSAYVRLWDFWCCEMERATACVRTKSSKVTTHDCTREIDWFSSTKYYHCCLLYFLLLSFWNSGRFALGLSTSWQCRYLLKHFFLNCLKHFLWYLSIATNSFF